MDKQKQKEIQNKIEAKGLERAKKIRSSLIAISFIISEFEIALQNKIPESIDIAKFIKDYGDSVNKTAIDFVNYCNAVDFLDEVAIDTLNSLVEKTKIGEE